MGPQKQSLVEILFGALEGWRKAGQMSRESVAIHVTEAHERIGADVATGITFESSKDAYTKAKTAAQKIYRWICGDEDGAAKLPANMLPTILAALPMEQRLSVLNQVLCSLGIEARAIDHGGVPGLDVSKLLRTVMKEGADAQLALANLSANATTGELLVVHKELIESAQVCERAAADVMTEIVVRQTKAAAN